MRNSYLIAIAFTAVFAIWMLSGLVFNDAEVAASAPQQSANNAEAELFKVAVKTMNAQSTPLFIKANGQVEPNRVVQLRAQTEGQIDLVFAREGEHVEQGELIARIALNDREIKLAEQNALLESRTKTLERLERLAQQNYQSQSELDRAKADVKSALAAIANIELDIAHTNISAPFSGTLEKMLVEQGDFVQVNGQVAVLLEQNPLLVTLPIAQQDINKIAAGDMADITLATGETVTGTLRYISPRANAQTRTFEVEIEIDNSDGKLRSGMSATAKIKTGEVAAHLISPALFSLGSEGQVGVKLLDEQDIVRFYPVDILQSASGGAWVSGLPASARIIVSGQGFVASGNKVRVEIATPSAGS
ncbi:efflux RND transporter periplasmic adaptor subunit [Glaciecola sp. SC05]|uniref:efflux RND transporter periplasmic adaptor subunit n=1 Tax=Glaciecola sp. SC05 TaxID=1987355 RepID=UPI003527B5F2